MRSTDPSLSAAERIDAACDRFELEWKAGRRPRIDDYLAAAPEADREPLRRALIDIEVELSGGVAADTSGTRSSLRSGTPTPVRTTEHAGDSQAGPPAIGRFEIRSVLGSGAFGKVYRAFDPQLGREVALKVPLESAVKTATERAHFLKEARAAATINHPNVYQIHEVGEHDGRPYIVMALVPGQSLADVLKARKEPLPQKQAALIVRKVALAIAVAHGKGIIHRDLKPANIMFDRERKDVVVMDFGLARGPKVADARATQSGVILGTPAYMSPEQARGASKAVGPAGDVFSLGVILYELLTGTRPFTGTATEVIGQILHVDPEPPGKRRPDLDPRLEAVCRKALAKDPAERFATMKELAAAIDAILRTPAGPEAESARASETRGDRESSANLADVLAAMSVQQKAARAETAAAVEEAVRRHGVPRRLLTVAGGIVFLALIALGGLIFFTRSNGVTVKVDLNGLVDLKDTTLSFFLDDRPVSAGALSEPVELTPGTHVLVAKRGEKVVKRIQFNVKSGRETGIEVTDTTNAETTPPTAKPSPLDVLRSEDIPSAVLTKVYGGREKAPPQLVAVHPNLRDDAKDDYHGFDVGPDGRTLAMSRHPWDMIEMMNLASGHRFMEHGIPNPRFTGMFYWVKLSPDGKMLFGVRLHGDLYAFDLANRSGKELWRTPTKSVWSKPAVSPDGSTVVAADKKTKDLRVLDARDGSERARWKGVIAGDVLSCQFSPDGKTFAITSGGLVKWIKVADGSVIRSIKQPSSSGAPMFSPDGKKVWTSRSWRVAEPFVIEVDLESEALREYRLPPKGCQYPILNPKYPIMATSDPEKSIHFWDTTLGPNQKPFTLSVGCPVERYCFTPEGRYLVVGCDNGIFVLRLPVERKVGEWPTPPPPESARQLNPADEDRKFAEWLLEIGVTNITVLVDRGQEKKIVKRADLPSEPFRVTDCDLAGNKKITDQSVDPILRWIERRKIEGIDYYGFFGTSIGDETVRRLVKLPSLKKLHVGGVKVTRACIPDVATRTDLAAVGFEGRPINDADLEGLLGLGNLKAISLQSTLVTDAGLKQLRGLKKLHTVWLSGASITGAGLDELAGLPIESLALGYSKVRGAEGLARLKKFPELRVVWLNGLLLGDEDLKPITECKSIEWLFLDDNRITDAGLEELAKMKWLKQLVLTSSFGTNPVTAAGVKKLRKALPNSKVVYEQPASP
jgi:hypothetical protein